MAVNVALNFILKDGGVASKFDAISKSIQKSAQATTQASEAAFKKSENTAKKSAATEAAAIEASTTRSRTAYERLTRSRELLGVRSEQSIQREIRQTEAAYNRLARSGDVSSRDLTRAHDAMVRKVRELRSEMGHLTREQKQAMLVQGAVATGVGIKVGSSFIANPVRSFATQEAAEAELRVAMMGAGGKVDTSYQNIRRQAIRFAGKLPGEIPDFVSAAVALKEQGMPASAIVGGGLEAASYFSVLANMDLYSGATTVAKTREAYGLKDEQLPQMADLMQKARYGFGIAPEDFRAVATYLAPSLNTMGITGMENARGTIAMQGIAAQKGLEASTFGTTAAMMLLRTAQVDQRLGGKGLAAKEAKEVMDEFGINLNFFNDKGQFAGVENMFAQMEKLRPLKDDDRIRALNKIFGVEASRLAAIMVEAGVDGFRQATRTIDLQADMQDRIDAKTGTLSSKQEALGGAWEQTKATAAAPIGEAWKSVLDGTSTFLEGTVTPTLQKYPGLGASAVAGAGITAGLVGAAGTAKAMQMMLGLPGAARMVSAIPGVAGLVGAASKLPLVPKGAGAFGIAATVGGAVLSSTLGEESAAARYGSAALTGAGLGATVGSIVPVIGTGIGAAIGGGIGLLVQAVTEGFSKQESPQAEMKADLTIGLAPGLVVTQQRTESNGPVNTLINTGNMWGIP